MERSLLLYFETFTYPLNTWGPHGLSVGKMGLSGQDQGLCLGSPCGAHDGYTSGLSIGFQEFGHDVSSPFGTHMGFKRWAFRDFPQGPHIGFQYGRGLGTSHLSCKMIGV